jgi:autotransporter-associated beta strand protein
VVNTSGGLTKTGNGTLTLSGANTYTGNTIIKGGTLELVQSVATLATNSTVSITNGAFLQLTAGTVTNVVASLVTNGVAAGSGLYTSVNSSGYITGSGYLKVGTTVAPTPEPINASYNANTGHLTLSWTQSGWRLEGQTNNLTTGLSPTGWINVSGASSPYVIPVDPSKPTVFYRLVNP